MKTKELIRILTNLDPESEVVVGGKSILGVEQLPGYYDGSYEKLIINDGEIQGMEYTREGTKSVISTFDAEDLIWHCNSESELANLLIKLDYSLSEHQKDQIMKNIEK
jgi:hypothetical protein